MEKVTRYKIYCETDNKWEYIYGEDDIAPAEKCPVDTAHVITIGSLSVDEVLDRSIHKYQTVITQDALSSRPFGFPKITATKNSTTCHTFLIDEALALRGGFVETKNHEFGDYMSFDITDEDNILGNGAGFVVSQYIKQWGCQIDGHNELKDESISNPLVPGLYGKLTYTSVGLTNDVEIMVTLFGYL